LSEQHPWIREGELLLGSKNLDPVEIIHLSEWKKTASILVSEHGKENQYLVKFCSSESPEIIKGKFLNEVDFYQSYDGCCVPEMIDCGDQYLILRYVESVTLLKWLDHYLSGRDTDVPGTEFTRLLAQLGQMLSGFYVNGDRECRTGAPAKSLAGRSNNLLGSGPHGTTRSNMELCISRYMRRASTRLLGWTMRQFEARLRYGNHNAWSPYIHMDLHGNNIIVDKDNGLYIIDFENTERGGIWFTDTAYLYAILMAGFYGFPAHQTCIDKQFKELVRIKDPELTGYWYQIANLFTRAALTNSRFRRGDEKLMPGLFVQYAWELVKFSLALLRR